MTTSVEFKMCIGFRVSEKIFSLFKVAMGFPSCCTNVERTANAKLKIVLYRSCRFPNLCKKKSKHRALFFYAIEYYCFFVWFVEFASVSIVSLKVTKPEILERFRSTFDFNWLPASQQNDNRFFRQIVFLKITETWCVRTVRNDCEGAHPFVPPSSGGILWYILT